MTPPKPASVVDSETPDGLISVDLKARPLSRLTYKILSFNLLVIFILAMGVSYLGSTRQTMIEMKLKNLEQETLLTTRLIDTYLKQNSSGSPADLASFLSQSNGEDEQMILIYSRDGKPVTQTGFLPTKLNDFYSKNEEINFLDTILIFLNDLFSVTFHLPVIPDSNTLFNLQKNDMSATKIHIEAWSSYDGGLVLTSLSPLNASSHSDYNALLLVRRALDVEQNFSEARLHVVRFLGLAMLMTIAHSLYLAGLIGHPLRKLAVAAEAYRLNRGRHVEIPDMSDRQDEIGELSHSMREMAGSLQRRLYSIEQFAADVAHELKNPLTSLRSALETLPRAKKDEDKERLMGVALHDLRRMDRLISDISQASRLDAELSRSEVFKIDLRDVIIPLIDSHRDPLERGTDNTGGNRVVCYGLDHPVYISGQIGRLEQVFQNLISNALSFAPENTHVVVQVESSGDYVKIMVDDCGPGIPENRLDKVFNRFYSERPVSEGFGMHSGLGLSIAKQIIEAHGGMIYAENRKNDDGQISGARFVVKLVRVI